MIVRSVNVGAPVTVEFEGKQVRTGFCKRPVECPLLLDFPGLPGDEQVLTSHHGGPEKAALLYPIERYPYWTEFLGRDPGPALLGETLTVEGLTEESACIGDVYRIGGALVQVCQPRVPCNTINVVHRRADMRQRVLDTGYTGFYVRVLEPGLVAAGDAIRLVRRPESALTVAFLNRTAHHEPENREAVAAIRAAEGLAEVWQGWMEKLLSKG